MPLYIAIVALARYLILDMKSMEDWRIAAISLSTLILAATVIVIRWGQFKMPYPKTKNTTINQAPELVLLKVYSIAPAVLVLKLLSKT